MNVFTRSPDKDDDNVEYVADPAGFIIELALMHGKDIWLVGGAEIITPLLNASLVAEIILSIHPVILGGGIPLFSSIEKRHDLKLTGSTAYPSGLVQLRYDVALAEKISKQ